MSESEKFEQQGKTYAALKNAKSNVATITSALNDYARQMEEVNRLISRLLANPEHRQDYILISTHLKQKMESLETERMVKLVEEFAAESAQVRELQQQVTSSSR